MVGSNAAEPLRVAKEDSLYAAESLRVVKEDSLYAAEPLRIADRDSLHTAEPLRIAEATVCTQRPPNAARGGAQGTRTILPVLPREETFSIARGASLIGSRSETSGRNAFASYMSKSVRWACAIAAGSKRLYAPQ
jgi:hypothetical protein